MWEYIEGRKVSVPDPNNPSHASWVIEDRNAHHRIWLARSDHIQDTVTNRDSAGLFRRLPRPLPPNSDIFTRTPTHYQNNTRCGN